MIIKYLMNQKSKFVCLLMLLIVVCFITGCSNSPFDRIYSKYKKNDYIDSIEKGNNNEISHKPFICLEFEIYENSISSNIDSWWLADINAEKYKEIIIDIATMLRMPQSEMIRIEEFDAGTHLELYSSVEYDMLVQFNYDVNKPDGGFSYDSYERGTGSYYLSVYIEKK